MDNKSDLQRPFLLQIVLSKSILKINSNFEVAYLPMNEYNIIIIKGIKIIVCVFILLLLHLISKLGKGAKIIVVARKCGIIFGTLSYSQSLLCISIRLLTSKKVR